MPLTTKHEVRKFSDGLWTINEFGLDDVFYIEGTERGLLIDTGTGVGDLRAVVDGIATKPYDVALTHGHVDHGGGVRQWDEVWVHPGDFEMLHKLTPQHRAEYATRMPREDSPFTVEDITDYARPMPELRPLEDGQVFDLGGRKVETIHTPGHTLGEVVFIDSGSRALISGDAANMNLLMNFGKVPSADRGYASSPIQTAHRALLRVKARESEFDYNFNGHVREGKPQPDGVLDDCIACMEGIMDGTIKKEKRILPPVPWEREGAFCGKVMIAFDESNIFE